jgi:hypothetical protein
MTQRQSTKTGPKPKPIAERFWPKVTKTDTCWLWTGAIRSGYGVIGLGGKYGKAAYAHRLSWEWANGPIPDGLCVLHRCDVRNCLRPDHLFLGTKPENLEDMTAKGRRARGESIGTAKLTGASVLQIRRAWEEGVPQYRLVRHFGVNQQTISAIVRRVTWKHI